MHSMSYVYPIVFFRQTDEYRRESWGAGEFEEKVNNGLGLTEHLAIHLTACILGSHRFSFALRNEMHVFHPNSTQDSNNGLNGLAYRLCHSTLFHRLGMGCPTIIGGS